MEIAFFDFDGTITRGDSFKLFIKFIFKEAFFLKVLQNIHYLIAYKLKLLDNGRAKEKFFYSCFKDMDETYFNKKCEDFLKELIPFCKESALKELQKHKENGVKVVLVSASFESYLSPLCKYLDIDLIGTQIEIEDSKITGNFSSKNCYGIEKVNRIKEKYDIKNFTKIYAYGDTRGDKEMLELATISHYRYFN